MNKSLSRVLTILFTVFIGAVFVLNMILPDKSFSEKENRYLQTLPPFSFSSLAGGTFTASMEDYSSDQFVGRDAWIALKARLELMQGKRENNGVFLCAGDRLLDAMSEPSAEQLDRQIGYVDALVDTVDVPVTLGLIPTAAGVYGELLPEGAQNADQAALIEYVYDRVTASTADIQTVLSRHKDEYIFYRTDHHWTSLGAFYGSEALAGPLGCVSPSYASLQAKTVAEDFLGTLYSSSGFFWIDGDQMQTLVDEPEDAFVERYETDTPEIGRIYQASMLSTKDKYRFFLGGNIPRSVIHTGSDDLPRLLVIRDSFADSLAPFLMEQYAEIHLLDLRYYRNPVSEYIRDHDIDQILVLYSVDDFCTDPSLALMAR